MHAFFCPTWPAQTFKLHSVALLVLTRYLHGFSAAEGLGIPHRSQFVSFPVGPRIVPPSILHACLKSGNLALDARLMSA